MPGAFSDVYVERSALEHSRTGMILSRLNGKTPPAIHEINSYKDVFYRSSHNTINNSIDICTGTGNNAAPDRSGHGINGGTLILARKKDHYIFRGSPVCQDFDEKHFYYASSAMNCIYDCEYCYLKGMYPSAHIVIYVNPEDTFDEIDGMLNQHPMYVCISYDTDLPALEGITGLVRDWAEFALSRRELRIECRTKCARTDLWDELPVNENFILAFTLSPTEIADRYEHRAPSLSARLVSIEKAIAAGHPVRLCFDPVIHTKDWEEIYAAMIDEVRTGLDLSEVRDISIGTFRISQNYLRRMRRNMPDSPPVNFPFETENGVCVYPDYLRNKMTDFMIRRLSEIVPGERIYT